MILSDHLRFLLVEPSHAGNIGSAARAMKVMGFTQLSVVKPREADPARHPEAIAFASRATDILDAMRVFPNLDLALADSQWNIAVSAASREFGPPALSPRELAAQIKARLFAEPAPQKLSLVFGPERTGLSIDDVQRCQSLCAIPSFGDYGSLNLAQAVQVLAYELALAFEQVSMPKPPKFNQADGEAWATDNASEQFFEHFERTAVEVGFLDLHAPKKLMPRIRRLFARSRLTTKEIDILRGFLSAAQKSAQGAKAKR